MEFPLFSRCLTPTRSTRLLTGQICRGQAAKKGRRLVCTVRRSWDVSAQCFRQEYYMKVLRTVPIKLRLRGRVSVILLSSFMTVPERMIGFSPLPPDSWRLHLGYTVQRLLLVGSLPGGPGPVTDSRWKFLLPENPLRLPQWSRVSPARFPDRSQNMPGAGGLKPGCPLSPLDCGQAEFWVT